MDDLQELRARVERLERRHAAYAVLAEYTRRALMMFLKALDRCFPFKEQRGD